MSLSFDFLDERPIVVVLAGSNGAGKTTFFESFLADAGRVPNRRTGIRIGRPVSDRGRRSCDPRSWERLNY